MKLQNLSTRAFLRLIVGGASLTSILLLFILYAFTKDIRMILGGFSVMIPSVSMGCSLFALFPEETIGIYRWTMPNIR